jgi:hypothetical protein
MRRLLTKMISPRASELGYKIIIWSMSILSVIYAWRLIDRHKKWGVWEAKWRTMPITFLFLGLTVILLLFWRWISS